MSKEILNKSKKIAISVILFIALAAIIITSINASITDYNTSVSDLAKEAQSESWYNYSPSKDLIGKKIDIGSGINYNSAYCIDPERPKEYDHVGYYDIVNVFDVNNNNNSVIVYSIENPDGTEYSLSDENIKPILRLSYLTQKATEDPNTNMWGYKDVLSRIFWNKTWINDLKNVGLSSSFHTTYYLDETNLSAVQDKIEEADKFANEIMKQGKIETAELSDSVMTQAEKDSVGVSRTEGKTYIGPYRISLRSSTVGEIKVNGDNVLGIATDIGEKEESVENVVDAKEFYIVTEKYYDEITSITVKAKTSISSMKSRMVLLGNSPSQNFLVWRSEKTEITPETELETPKLGTLEIQKVDEFKDSTISLKDIEFKVYSENNGWLDNNGTEKVEFIARGEGAFDKARPFKTDENGKITLGNLPTGYYWIYETGLTKELEEIYQLDTTKVPGESQPKKALRVESEELREAKSLPYKFKVSSGQTITVTAENHRAFVDIIVHKKDKDTQRPLSGYEFMLYRVDEENPEKQGWVEAKNNIATGNYVDYDSKDVAKIFTINGTTAALRGVPVGKYELYETKNGEYGEAYDLGTFVKDGKEYPGHLVDTKEVVADKTGEYEFYEENPQEFIKISGFVWEDYLEGKTSMAKDGEFTNKDCVVEGIEVTLYDTKTGERRTAYTDSEGKYLFDKVRIRENRESEEADYLENYRIIFKYDGFTYQGLVTNEQQMVKYEGKNVQTIPSTSSKVIEQGKQRNELNNLFDNITGEGQTLANGVQLKYSKTEDRVVLQNIGKRTVVSEPAEDGSKTGLVKVEGTGDFPIESQTPHSILQDYYNLLSKTQKVVTEIPHINLSIRKREMPNLTVEKDVYNAEVSINGYTYTYMYNNKLLSENAVETTLGADFDGDYNLPIYQADVEYKPENKTNELQATVTYKIKLQNSSNNLYTKINGIYEWYSEGYSIAKDEDGEYAIYLSDNNAEKTFNKNNRISGVKSSENRIQYSDFSRATIEFDEPIEFAPSTTQSGSTKYLYIKFKVNDIKEIYNKTDAKLENYAEISAYTTYEDEEYKKLYAAIDETSIPRNMNADSYKETKEDDSDKAPALHIVDAGNRSMTGTVFEDNDADGKVGVNEERKGNGIFDNGETTISNVNVQLVDVNGNKVQVYNGKEWVDSDITTTDENGNFTVSGFIPGKYKVIYTWGDDKYKVEDYKGTIYVKTETHNIENSNWIKEEDPRYSDAIDDYNLRIAIDQKALYNKDTEGYTDLSKMNSTTPTFNIGIEKQEYEELPGEEGYKFDIKNVDFGIIERPRQAMEINKELKSVKLTTNDGALVVDAEIQDDGKLKATVGEKWVSGGGDLGYIWVQVDKSITQGMKAEMGYNIKVSNVSEKDYDSEKYYKYGETNGANESTMTLQAEAVYDYCKGSTLSSQSATVWETVEPGDYKIDTATKETITDENFAEQYNKTVNDNGDTINTYTWENSYEVMGEVYTEWAEQMPTNKQITTETIQVAKLQDREILKYVQDQLTQPLTPGQSKTAEIKTSKEIANGDEIRFDNDAEITHIDFSTDRKTGRKPSAYTSKTYDRGGWTTITPATGENRDYMWIIIASVSAISILGIGIIIIKKKILK